MEILSGIPLHLRFTGGLLAVLVLVSLTCFFVPAVVHWFRLNALLRRVRRVEKKNARAELKKVFDSDERLAHLWKEYQDSLHAQHEERNGELVTVAVRATLPAETSFNSQFVIDSRLRTEFFKHLPGVLTGIGIIGTFSGLIDGLRKFQVSENALTVRNSLESLMHSVGEAFIVSAAAIGAAMLITLFEKILLASLYKKTEEIAHAIDAAFDSGAGEEYLSRLVRASEDSATQSKILKDALVKELGELLRELTSSQIAASQEAARAQVQAVREDNQALGAAIAESIKSSLQEPMKQIADTVSKASGDQSATASRMLQDVMSSFSQRLNDLFGGQISGLSKLNEKTAQSIQDAVSTLQALVANVEESSKRSADTMAERMAQAVERMEARQEAINAQSAAFVEQIRQLVASSQGETASHLRTTLRDIENNVTAMLSVLNESQRKAHEEGAQREAILAQRTSEALSGMSTSVDGAAHQMAEASRQIAQSVAEMTHATGDSIAKMGRGAEDVNVAAQRFAAAGDRVGSVMTAAAGVAERLTQTSGALSQGATAIQSLLSDYQEQRTAVVSLLQELRNAVDSARREATLTADVLSRIQSSSEALGAAQRHADEYLKGISDVLGEAHSSFAKEVTRTLDQANHEFHKKLTSAVGLLSSAVDELEVTLSAMGTLTPSQSRR